MAAEDRRLEPTTGAHLPRGRLAHVIETNFRQRTACSYILNVSSTTPPATFHISLVFWLVCERVTFKLVDLEPCKSAYILLVSLANRIAYSDVVITARLTHPLSNLSAKLAVDPMFCLSDRPPDLPTIITDPPTPCQLPTSHFICMRSRRWR
jgi:hypothetical protein